MLRVHGSCFCFFICFGPLLNIKARSSNNFDQPCRLRVEFTRGKCDGESGAQNTSVTR